MKNMQIHVNKVKDILLFVNIGGMMSKSRLIKKSNCWNEIQGYCNDVINQSYN